MTIKNILGAVAVAVLTASPVLAADISVREAYARSASPTAKSGAAFMVIENTGTEDDILIAAQSKIADRVELHTHLSGDDGIMRMRPIEDGIPVPAGESHILKRGGDHVMFMGLVSPILPGTTIPVTLVFQNAGPVDIEIPVDLERTE